MGSEESPAEYFNGKHKKGVALVKAMASRIHICAGSCLEIFHLQHQAASCFNGESSDRAQEQRQQEKKPMLALRSTLRPHHQQQQRQSQQWEQWEQQDDNNGGEDDKGGPHDVSRQQEDGMGGSGMETPAAILLALRIVRKPRT